MCLCLSKPRKPDMPIEIVWVLTSLMMIQTYGSRWRGCRNYKESSHTLLPPNHSLSLTHCCSIDPRHALLFASSSQQVSETQEIFPNPNNFFLFIQDFCVGLKCVAILQNLFLCYSVDIIVIYLPCIVLYILFKTMK